ncbi:hypothetical protein Hypma_014409 [Hypsizygus marmoreus]|uniref:Uncharacterized protein n=1 Tax=Hypsizygus marmoreus TaxID=39966 RepID=A0A369JF11_HYPMA|nr:hypothetical protein Hypma_014409 [Hypsizygus marmoreus]
MLNIHVRQICIQNHWYVTIVRTMIAGADVEMIRERLMDGVRSNTCVLYAHNPGMDTVVLFPPTLTSHTAPSTYRFLPCPTPLQPPPRPHRDLSVRKFFATYLFPGFFATVSSSPLPISITLSI